jgi:hypothetical protein
VPACRAGRRRLESWSRRRPRTALARLPPPCSPGSLERYGAIGLTAGAI